MEGYYTKVTLAVLLVFGVSLSAGKVPDPKELWFVGTAGNKTYFAEAITLRTWFEAKEYCESWEMRLATITNEEEAGLLIKAWDQINFWHPMWVGARDAHTLVQMVWDMNNSEIKEYGVSLLGRWGGPRTCLLFASEETDYAYYLLADCNTKQRTLCESFDFVQ